MRRTLFYLPDEIAGLPVFGVGWALAAWLVISAVLLAVTVRRHGWDREAAGHIPLAIVVALAIVFLIPKIEVPLTEPALVIPPVPADSGLPIRGYGVMLLVAVVMAVALACQRAARAGLSPEVILNLAFVLTICGILGARLFFVIQYWPTLRGDSWRETMGNLLSIDKGGLVVYGSVIGIAVGFLVYARRHRLPVLPLADLITPSLALGLAIGRVGCLMNGCCFGGICEQPWALSFPAGSPPYQEQKSWGEFHGLRLAVGPGGQPIVARVDPDGPFARIPEGAVVDAMDGYSVKTLSEARYVLESSATRLSLTTSDGTRYVGDIDALPDRSQPVHPTQLYSALNGALLCGLTLLFYPYRWKHGQVIALLLTLYAATRFLLEMIRIDESAVLAEMTISQNVSVAVAIGMAVLWIYIQRRPAIERSSS